MIDDAYRRYRLLEKAMETDEEYLWLTGQSREIEPRAEAVFRTLSQE